MALSGRLFCGRFLCSAAVCGYETGALVAVLCNLFGFWGRQ